MKKYQVHITKYAYRQLKRIRQYIEVDLQAPQAAKNTLRLIKSAIVSLDHMPERYALTDHDKWRQEGIRKVVVKNYIVYYRVDEERMQVQVTAVVSIRQNQAMELMKMLPDEE